jgi:uroporphyrinogen decarboxylase
MPAERLTTHERMVRIYEHRDADRIPVTDDPWASTVERWEREGMPRGADFAEYFGADDFRAISVDNSPRYPEGIVEATDEYTIRTTSWGATLKNWKHAGGVPEFLDFVITDADSWRAARERLTPNRDRVPWARLAEHWPAWRKRGAWISAGLWFGFDVTHSWMIGTERALMAMATDPGWIVEMWNTQLDMDLAHLELAWDAGYTVDAIEWPDDMGYKLNQFFSLDMYRELLRPVHKRACDWAHARGCKVRLHSCGDIRPFVPELVEIGVDMLNPLEVKAGVDPLALKARWGDRLAFHGGLNAVLYRTPELLWAEMRRVIPGMKERGGYVASTDHSVPDSVSLPEFKEFIRLAKDLGRYD